MIKHPDTVLPAEALPGAYAALMAALAAHEPEALARATGAIEDEARNGGHPSENLPPAAALARAWLAFTGHLDPTAAPDGAKVYSFSYPATVAFDMVGTGGRAAARRRANQVIAGMLTVDQPLCAVQGPFPGHPSLLNVEIWLGSAGKNDELDLEGSK